MLKPKEFPYFEGNQNKLKEGTLFTIKRKLVVGCLVERSMSIDRLPNEGQKLLKDFVGAMLVVTTWFSFKKPFIRPQNCFSGGSLGSLVFWS